MKQGLEGMHFAMAAVLFVLFAYGLYWMDRQFENSRQLLNQRLSVERVLYQSSENTIGKGGQGVGTCI